jgi:carboxyl-terminal processing protease
MVVLFFFVFAGFGDPIQEVNQLLDRVEKAYDAHDALALADQYNPDGFLVIVQRPQGALVLNRQQALTGIPQVWGQIASHRFVRRDIFPMGDLALMRVLIADRYTDGRNQTSEFLNVAVHREGVWKMCFGVEMFVRPVVLVTGFAGDSSAQKAGVQVGDIVTTYQEQEIQTVEQLQAMIQSTQPGDKVTLSVLRGDQPNRFEAAGGMLGIQCEQRLLPNDNAVLIGEDQKHPIFALMQEELSGFVTGDVQRACGMMHPTHFLAMIPRPGQGCLLVTKETVPTVYQEMIPLFRQQCDLTTAKYLNMQVIEHGDLAIASNRFEADRRDPPGGKVSYPSQLEVFIRQQNQWYLTAILPVRAESGAQPGKSPAVSLSKQQTQELQQNLKGELSGIGIEIETHPEGIEIRKVFESSGAEKAGLQIGEVILSIDEKPVQGLTIAQAAEMMRGQEGSDVFLKVKSILGAVRTVRVIRVKFDYSNVTHRVIADQTGYLKISGFNENTVAEVQQAIRDFSQKQVSGVILDLRGCGGGLAGEIVKTADVFLPPQKALWIEKYKDGKIVRVQSREAPLCDLPMVVLIDSQTQAGELLAAAFKINQRAILLGEKGSGACSIRTLKQNPDGSSQKIELGNYYLDTETPISGVGVKPDIEIDLKMTTNAQVIHRAINILRK